jgi:hypothetical protein
LYVSFGCPETVASFEKFVDSPYYTKSELCGGAVIVSFLKYLPYRLFATSFRRIVEQAVLAS